MDCVRLSLCVCACVVGSGGVAFVTNVVTKWCVYGEDAQIKPRDTTWVPFGLGSWDLFLVTRLAQTFSRNNNFETHAFATWPPLWRSGGTRLGETANRFFSRVSKGVQQCGLEEWKSKDMYHLQRALSKNSPTLLRKNDRIHVWIKNLSWFDGPFIFLTKFQHNVFFVVGKYVHLCGF